MHLLEVQEARRPHVLDRVDVDMDYRRAAARQRALLARAYRLLGDDELPPGRKPGRVLEGTPELSQRERRGGSFRRVIDVEQ